MKTKLLTNKLFTMLASLLAVTSLLLMSATPAFARSLDSGTSPQTQATNMDDRLSSEFRHARDLLSRLKGDLNADHEQLSRDLTVPEDNEKSDLNKFSASRLAILEAREQSILSQDSSALAAIEGAQAMISSAETLLSASSGFDKVGGVTNAAVASETVKSIDAMLTNMQFIIDHANTLLTKAQSGI